MPLLGRESLTQDERDPQKGSLLRPFPNTPTRRSQALQAPLTAARCIPHPGQVMSPLRLNKQPPLPGDRTELGGDPADSIPSSLRHHLWDLDRRWTTLGWEEVDPCSPLEDLLHAHRWVGGEPVTQPLPASRSAPGAFSAGSRGPAGRSAGEEG